MFMNSRAVAGLLLITAGASTSFGFVLGAMAVLMGLALGEYIAYILAAFVMLGSIGFVFAFFIVTRYKYLYKEITR